MTAEPNLERVEVVSLDQARRHRDRPAARYAPILPEVIPPPHEWPDLGSCTQQPDSDGLFFGGEMSPDQKDALAEAKLICSACPVLDLCREFALQEGIGHGVWGGLSEGDRRRIRAQQRRQAA